MPVVILTTGADRFRLSVPVGNRGARPQWRVQVEALGSIPTAVVNAVDALSRSGERFVPEILVAGGGGGGVLQGLAAQIMQSIGFSQGEKAKATPPETP
ncbi:MAG: hypothetical protein KKE56_05090 [Actinobacteria bacterium]|nr:hypothetical protein [Actinomycetota bacterium]